MHRDGLKGFKSMDNMWQLTKKTGRYAEVVLM